MSRLAGRIRRLEQRYQGCPTCAQRAVVSVMEYVGPDGVTSLGPRADSTACPDCGQPPEILTIRVHFDHRTDPGQELEPGTPPLGSVQWEREQQRRQAER